MDLIRKTNTLLSRFKRDAAELESKRPVLHVRSVYHKLPSLIVLTRINYYVKTFSFHKIPVLDSFLQFVVTSFGALGLSSVPVAQAETLEQQVWPEKYALEIVEELEPELPEAFVFAEKEELLNLGGNDLYWVVAVLDGDTLLLSAPDRSLFQVRLLAVDTNEINGPDSTAECYGVEAALFTMEFLANRAVRLTADPANQDLDPYGRKLRYVDVLQEDGSLTRLNDALLFEGYATFPEQYPVTDPAHFENLEKQAQTQGKGLWGAC